MRTGIGNFQGEKLTQAREVLGLTKHNLANLVEVSPASIGNWESNKLKPELDKLQALCSCLNQSMDWFTSEDQNFEGENYFYRTLHSSSKNARLATKIRLEWLASLTFKLSKWVDWPELKTPENKHHFLMLTDEEIEGFAKKARIAAGIGKGPVTDVVLAMENSGVIVSRDEIGHLNVDGTTYYCDINKRPFVFLASDKSNGCRSRFDAAHEFGHVVLHRHVTEQEHKDYHKEIERQANLFASSFLLPEVEFVKGIKNITVESLLAIKPKWKVSIAAMVMRCWQLGIIDDNQKSNLFKRLSARRWRLKEPYDDRIQFELPRVLPRTVKLIVDNVTEKDELLNELGLSRYMCEGLLGLPSGYFADTHKAENIIELKTKYRNPSDGTQKGDVVKFGR